MTFLRMLYIGMSSFRGISKIKEKGQLVWKLQGRAFRSHGNDHVCLEKDRRMESFDTQVERIIH